MRVRGSRRLPLVRPSTSLNDSIWKVSMVYIVVISAAVDIVSGRPGDKIFLQPPGSSHLRVFFPTRPAATSVAWCLLFIMAFSNAVLKEDKSSALRSIKGRVFTSCAETLAGFPVEVDVQTRKMKRSLNHWLHQPLWCSLLLLDWCLNVLVPTLRILLLYITRVWAHFVFYHNSIFLYYIQLEN